MKGTIMKRIVLLSGKTGSGKNTFADMLKEELGDKAHLESFARPLKELCYEVFKPVMEIIGDFGDDQWGRHCLSRDVWFEKKTPVTRLLLQIVGTDIVRVIDPDYWVNRTIQNIQARPEPIIIMTDWRFPGELLGIGSISHFHPMTIKVNRDVTREGVEHEHSSETALDFFAMDQTIQNNGTLFDLKREAQSLAYTLIEETLH